MKILVLGGTGMVGSDIAKEAARRGHDVTIASRSGSTVHHLPSATIDLQDTDALVSTANPNDALVIAVPSDRTGGDTTPTIEAHRRLIAAAPQTRLFVVGGAGALSVGDVLLKDTPEFPAAYKAESDTFAAVLDLYRAAEGLDWTMLAPSPMIAPGPAGEPVLGTDSPVGDSVTTGTFAVAALDELEQPAHRGTRFTVADKA
ncbi:NAD(P)H-binding protein [Yimella sp. cx-573]|nr:NAD(P)H-binding protein [Yimella sp. cx-573]